MGDEKAAFYIKRQTIRAAGAAMPAQRLSRRTHNADPAGA
jgi:hypothetical protein